MNSGRQLRLAMAMVFAFFGYDLRAEDVSSVLFDQYEISIPMSERPAVLTGDFLGDNNKEIAVAYRDKRNQTQLLMFEFNDNSWRRVVDTELDAGSLFVDVVSINSQDRLLLVTHDYLAWIDPVELKVNKLVEVSADYNTSDQTEINTILPAKISVVDVTRDLNGDRHDDLIVPDTDGFFVSIQSDSGEFSAPAKLGPAEPFLGEAPIGSQSGVTYGEMGINASTLPWYLSRVHSLDFNQDGRPDLLFWNRDHFDVYEQASNGMFQETPDTFEPSISFDADGVYSLNFGFSDESTFNLFFGLRKKTTRTVLHSFQDLNGDGYSDLVIQTLTGRSLLKQRNTFAIHLGAAGPDSIHFSSAADTRIRPGGNTAGVQDAGYSSHRFQDFDGDGQVDAGFMDVNIGLTGMMRAMVGNSISMNLQSYRLQKDEYPHLPSYQRKIRPELGIKSGNLFFPLVLVGDVNGDGRTDLLLRESRGALSVFKGVPGPTLFSNEPQIIPMNFPQDERHIWLVDLNRDNRQDILALHMSNEIEPRLVSLITR